MIADTYTYCRTCRDCERYENAAVIATPDEGTYNLLARCAHNYTRGMADALEWVLCADAEEARDDPPE